MKVKRIAQNLIELVFVFPVLILLLFGTIELAMFWKTVHTVENLAFQATANAANQVVTVEQTSDDDTDIDCTDGACFNFAVAKAINVVQKKQGMLGVKDLNFSCTSRDGYGTRPYAIYDCVSDTNNPPRLKLTVDYRNPYKNGITAQLVFQYKTLLLNASNIIPNDFEISSTKIKQYNQY